ncbi:MAG: response regulator transcription factor [Cyclobacteriaceae bacterium]|mgnify:FL=1|nr:MAG: response regulator transcription factor [Cyclobacteriaceae bacterium]
MNKKITRDINVYIADDHTLFRKAMVNLLRTFSRVNEVKDAENGKELLELVKKEPPQVVVVDLQMPIMDGVEASEILVRKFPDVKVIMLTMHDSEKYILHMVELGVHAFLLKNTEPEELERAIYTVHDKDFYHNDLVANVLRKSIREQLEARRPEFSRISLTDREKEILHLICKEMTIREIGLHLNISENTVRNHRVNLMEKIGTDNAIGLVRFAYESGLLT